LIADVVARDLPYYDPTISEQAVAGINRFAKACGLMTTSPRYDQIVAIQFRDLWTAQASIA
jgi:NitT/TauT family transport system substrate-binding protein